MNLTKRDVSMMSGNDAFTLGLSDGLILAADMIQENANLIENQRVRIIFKLLAVDMRETAKKLPEL